MTIQEIEPMLDLPIFRTGLLVAISWTGYRVTVTTGKAVAGIIQMNVRTVFLHSP